MANINDNEKSSLSQNKQIAEYLNNGGVLTQMDALKMFNCFRLASRINDLRNKGLDIVTEKIITASGKTVAQYRLNK
jgi:hypothetical protein